MCEHRVNVFDVLICVHNGKSGTSLENSSATLIDVTGDGGDIFDTISGPFARHVMVSEEMRRWPCPKSHPCGVRTAQASRIYRDALAFTGTQRFLDCWGRLTRQVIHVSHQIVATFFL